MSDTTIGQRDGLRDHLHAMWSAVAPGWAAHADFIDDRGADVTDAMLFIAAPQPGERVLELACGPGGPGFGAAPLVAPTGAVVMSDVSAEMTQIAAARARERELESVSCRVLDLEEIDEPDASFDVVLCREGLMLVSDPARAAAEIRRVLAPGGRVVLSVWGPRERNPWLGVVFDTVSAQLGMPIPPPGRPHPFSLADSDELAALLRDAGLSGVTVTELPTPYRAASVDEWWERTKALAGPLSAVLAALPEADAQELRDRAAAAIAPYSGPAGLVIPGVCLLGTASV
jgi:enediyne biosynthesis protein CalE5